MRARLLDDAIQARAKADNACLLRDDVARELRKACAKRARRLLEKNQGKNCREPHSPFSLHPLWIWSPPLVLFGDRHSGKRGTRHCGKRAEKAGTGLCTKLEGVKLVASGNSKKSMIFLLYHCKFANT